MAQMPLLQVLRQIPAVVAVSHANGRRGWARSTSGAEGLQCSVLAAAHACRDRHRVAPSSCQKTN
eukprot:CAMPEP_0169399576 /NCGR_PEP_ID=MMETSP1017-20121227/53321_1 /TAXON_ID=342587 /ORGANISM="Karlodinium micrum, Strain CCMP2283" /LENGTH=64 /DNA_ID=CAMNT_0009504783 /DNA_START=410 /DNA_END=604 /DNA_ORIENTATION=-